MKKTILLALAFLAGILKMGGGAARRGDNNDGKSDVFNFLPALCVVFVIGLLTACGGFVPIQYYNYKSGESNFYAAQSVCRGKAEAAAPPYQRYEEPRQKCYGVFGCTWVNDNSEHRAVAINKFYEQCITQAGWLPCSQGGQGRPECACLNPGPSGKPTCK